MEPRTHAVKVGDRFRVSGVRAHRGVDLPLQMKVCDAPNGGRREFGGPIDPAPFCFLIPCATVLADDGGATYRALKALPVISIDTVIEVEGYGRYRMIVPKYNRENIQLLEDCTASSTSTWKGK